MEAPVEQLPPDTADTADTAAPAPSPAPAAGPGERGQGLVEYALIIFLVSIVVISILLLLGPQIGDVFSSIYATI